MLSIQEFGDQLIRTGDLDPVYIAIYDAHLPEPQLCRLLLAYWCFYHLGVSAWLSERDGDSFWSVMDIAARNEITPQQWSLEATRWPRERERRHFRGAKCVEAVRWMATTYEKPEAMVRDLKWRTTDKMVMDKLQSVPLFGPWIGFKAADMMERVYGSKVQFDANIGLLYSEPAKALDILSIEMRIDSKRDIYNKLLTYFSPRPAPPGRDRGCGPQEVETVLCKWKSHHAGRYQVGKDITEVRHALKGWGPTADRMLAACPKEVQ